MIGRIQWVMQILMKDTENNVRMFANNSIVQDDQGILGRVINYDKYSHVIYVMVRVNTFSWKIEKWHPYCCNEIQTFLWSINTPFACRYQSHYRSPDLRPMDMDID